MSFSFTSAPENSARLTEDSRSSFCGSCSMSFCIGLLTMSERSERSGSTSLSCPNEIFPTCLDNPSLHGSAPRFVHKREILHFPIATNKLLSSQENVLLFFFFFLMSLQVEHLFCNKPNSSLCKG